MHVYPSRKRMGFDHVLCMMDTCMSTANTIKHMAKRLNIPAITWIGLSKNSEVTQTLSMTGQTVIRGMFAHLNFLKNTIQRTGL